MIRFLLKGLVRDRQRSLLPFLVVGIGVMLTVFMHTWVTGVIGDSIEFNARFDAGHMKVVTRAYAENSGQLPIDLALGEITELNALLESEFPGVEWVERTRFSGLIDFAGENGETVSQGPAIGMALDLLSPDTREPERMNITESMVRGVFPEKPGQILITEEFSQKLGVNPGDEITLISSTMNGSMAFYNFQISGTIAFGAGFLDRGTIIVDVEDARLALDMDNASGELLGFFESGFFDKEQAKNISLSFNEKYEDKEDMFSPVMLSMRDKTNLAKLIDISEMMTSTILFVFVLFMSIILWNTGLISGLRRYGEVGIRLAIGESKGHIFRSMINESIAVGIAGSFAGTIVGLMIAYIIQTKGINFGDVMENSAIMMPTTFKTRITPPAYFIGFIPGVFSIVLGTALSGIGIYKRNTAQLFKELE